MIRAQDLLGSDEELRLRDCAEEPIHLPGAIQPHGALLAVDADSHEILQVSANSDEVLGISASSLLGSNVDALIGVEAATFLQPGFVATTTGSNWTLAEVNGRAVTVIVHLVGDVGVVEFEPVGSRSDASQRFGPVCAPQFVGSPRPVTSTNCAGWRSTRFGLSPDLTRS